MDSNKKLRPTVTELFLGGRKLNISLVSISQSYVKVPKTIRLNATHYLIMKIPNKRHLQQIVSNHSSDIDFKDFMKFYKDYDLERTYYKMSISKKIKAINNKIKHFRQTNC